MFCDGHSYVTSLHDGKGKGKIEVTAVVHLRNISPVEFFSLLHQCEAMPSKTAL